MSKINHWKNISLLSLFHLSKVLNVIHTLPPYHEENETQRQFLWFIAN